MKNIERLENILKKIDEIKEEYDQIKFNNFIEDSAASWILDRALMTERETRKIISRIKK